MSLTVIIFLLLPLFPGDGNLPTRTPTQPRESRTTPGTGCPLSGTHLGQAGSKPIVARMPLSAHAVSNQMIFMRVIKYPGCGLTAKAAPESDVGLTPLLPARTT